MKWKKLGKIFDPRDHKLLNNCVEFAQSPQTLLFDDFVRIYFSTREKDKTGKFLSHISFIDFDKNFTNIINVSKKTVIKLGNLGCFDEHGIFPLNILRTKNKILGYIGGWSRRVSVSVETSIGLAISDDDGLTFKRVGDGPVLTSSQHEPFLVGDPFVQIYNNKYHMWYIYGIKWLKETEGKEPQRIYKIGHATSEDGFRWQKEGRQLIPDKLNLQECQALPTIINFDDQYHMLFCYREAIGFRENKDRGYRLGYAFSQDLTNWIRDDSKVGIEVSRNGWDSDMLCYPHVFRSGDKIYLLYNGNEFGRCGFGMAVLEE
ncbi:MAG: hypothetical protein WC841_01735 [Candidatus Shapirobacteria bacterium]|jgi:hypothetical protein